MVNIQEILITSLKDRNIFHSEADFQHHLAWHIHTELQNPQLRLEYPLSKNGSNSWEYCDIVLKSPYNIGIELKYKTKRFTTKIEGESFELKNQSAQDIGRYGFLKDVKRLETWCKDGKINSGYAIILTNDSSYWTKPTKDDTKDKDFRLHNRKIINKLDLDWKKDTSKTTKKGRGGFKLENEYSLEWKDVDSNVPNSNFRYILLKVECPTVNASAECKR